MAGRRRNTEELPFSLDAFLDIVANLVGILIRLIVMVGLTVRSLPSTTERQQAELQKKAEVEYQQRKQEWESEKSRIDAENARRARLREQAKAERETELRVRQQTLQERLAHQEELDRKYDERTRAVAERLAVLRSYEQQAQEMQSEVSVLGQQRQREVTLLDRELAAARSAEHALEEQSKTLAELKAELEKEQAELDAERLKRTTLDEQLAELRDAIKKIESLPKPVRTVTHYGASIAERVEIEERHFRCKGGRIVHTHMSDLVEMMRRRLYAALDSKLAPSDGSVGPVGGFILKFELDRGESSFVGSLQTGSREPGIRLKRFVLVAESDRMGETAEEALAAGSEFQKTMATANAQKVVPTLWVYPDSFDLAKSIEEALHRAGFAVAIRPLAEQMPISGSPSGTASEAH